MALWVDSDFGFDDLWALMVLRAGGMQVDGVSMVAGNAPLAQVIRNALGAEAAFGWRWPLYAGAARPLTRTPETAERILGPTGMQSRGARLPDVPARPLPGAADAMAEWLDGDGARDILALGPLTNLAHLARARPDAFAARARITWMGGSAGRGNHTEAAEFNALADPEALAEVATTGAELRIVDLEACRQVTFDRGDMPALGRCLGSPGSVPRAARGRGWGQSPRPAGRSGAARRCRREGGQRSPDPASQNTALATKPTLLTDLLGGYLDIALSRGREAMAIYDPLAALALTHPDAVQFDPRALTVCTKAGADYGSTRFIPAADSRIRLATRIAPDAATLCLDALTTEAAHA